MALQGGCDSSCLDGAKRAVSVFAAIKPFGVYAVLGDGSLGRYQVQHRGGNLCLYTSNGARPHAIGALGILDPAASRLWNQRLTLLLIRGGIVTPGGLSRLTVPICIY